MVQQNPAKMSTNPFLDLLNKMSTPYFIVPQYFVASSTTKSYNNYSIYMSFPPTKLQYIKIYSSLCSSSSLLFSIFPFLTLGLLQYQVKKLNNFYGINKHIYIYTHVSKARVGMFHCVYMYVIFRYSSKN